VAKLSHHIGVAELPIGKRSRAGRAGASESSAAWDELLLSPDMLRSL
jgi:hypothetical protein